MSGESSQDFEAITAPIRGEGLIARVRRWMAYVTAFFRRGGRAESMIVATVSHEMRNALSLVLGYVELLESAPADTGERKDLLQSLRRGGEHLLALANDLVDVKKIESGSFEIRNRSMSVANFLRDLQNFGEWQTRAKGVRFRIDPALELPARIMIDPCRVRQILFNMVGNAAKFTSAGEVRVRMALAAEELLFEISDTGIGMSADQAEKIFVPFIQVGAPRGRREGAGLGLAIARSIARQMGGEISLARTAPSLGSSFVVRLKTGCESPPASAFPNAIAASASKKESNLASGGESDAVLSGLRVLVVDDSADSRMLISRFLTGSGAQVEVADNGEDGIQKATQGHKFDVVLMDLQMPKFDGFQAVRALRSMGFHQPIVALTACAFKEIRDACLKSGFNLHLPKPVRRSDLIRLVSDLARVKCDVVSHLS